MFEEKVHYYFKLCGNIADPIEVKFAKIEIEGLFPGKLNDILNFADVLIQPRLKRFLTNKIRVQDIITRDTCYGQVQGFHSEYGLVNISDLVRRLAYTREIYVLVENRNEETPEEVLRHLHPTGKVGGDVQIFKLVSDSHLLFRFIAYTYYFENMRAAIYFSFAKTKKRMWERVKENVERLINHVMEGYYYVPLHPRATMHKEVEDLFDERKEEKLYLSHAFGPPYKAKFHPRMVKAMMNYIGIKNGVLLDPFVGSGTMSIECTLTGVDSIGVDVSPVCILATKAKIASLNVNLLSFRAEIDSMLEKIRAWKDEGVAQRTLYEIEHDEVVVPEKIRSSYPGKEKELVAIYKLKNLMTEYNENKKLSKQEAQDISSVFACALSKVVSQALRAKTSKNVIQTFEDEIEEIYKAILAFEELKKRIDVKLGSSKNYIGDVRCMQKIPGLEPKDEGNVDGIITSPPYSTAVDYIRNDLPMLQIIHEADIGRLGKDMMGNPRFRDNEIQLLDEIRRDKGRFKELPSEAKGAIRELLKSGKKKLALRQYKFLIDIKSALQEMFRVLKLGSKCVIIIGNNHFRSSDKVIEFRNAQYIFEMAPSIGFKTEKMIERTLLKTSYGAIREEYLLFLSK